MSKAAITFLVLAIMTVAADQLLPASLDAMSTVTNAAGGVFAILFVAALFVGRRYKFDPVLR